MLRKPISEMTKESKVINQNIKWDAEAPFQKELSMGVASEMSSEDAKQYPRFPEEEEKSPA